MGIIENAAEIDRLYILQDKAERENSEARAAVDRAMEAASRSESCRQAASERIEMLYDGIACSIPGTVDECLALVVLLRSQTADSVFDREHEEGQARKRVDRIIDNLVVGLNRLSTADTIPHWFEDHILDAETGTTVDLEEVEPPSINENGQSPHH